jgi:hypothetical protein
MVSERRVRTWSVPYEATVRGTAIVEAFTADGAKEQVDAGHFDLDGGQEMTDWKVTGMVREES